MSVRREDYCCESFELIENFQQAEAEGFKGWDLHHRAEILPCGKFSAYDLKKFGLYWNRPASELVFLRHGEHIALHMQGNKFAEGHVPWNRGKKHLSETRQKISKVCKQRYLDPEFKRRVKEALAQPEVVARRAASCKKTVASWSEEKKQAFAHKISLANKGRKQTPEEVEKRRNSLKKFYQEHPEKREEWSRHFKNMKRTESWCTSISKSLCKPVIAIEMNTREEHHFSSLAEACEFLHAKVGGNISHAIKTQKPYRGFFWSRP